MIKKRIPSNRMIKRAVMLKMWAAATIAVFMMPLSTSAKEPQPAPDAAKSKDIKAYCIDFNWEKVYGKPKLARLGAFAKSDPADHFAWYKMMGVTTIQTFCVSTNGYAWYKNGVVPEQPGLVHDYLPEMVKLGHAEGMKVFGYFTIGANPRWAKLRPDLNYGAGKDGQISGGYHVVYTDEYLKFLSTSIADAVGKTGIDGFMIDWLWQPSRKVTNGRWIEAEKKLYKQLMGKPYPGDKELTSRDELAYSRKALTRAWKAIRKAAKDTSPDCKVWLTVNKMDHPHMLDSEIYQEVDWLMNEAGDMERISHIKDMIGNHSRLITCMAAWTGVNATEVVPQALEAKVGLYGFNDPKDKNVKSLAALLAKPVWGLKGDDRNIATLARAYNGVALDTVRNEKGEWIPLAKPEAKPVSGEAKPNVVIITADDLMWTDLSMTGSNYANTPNLQKLADAGAFFPRGYVPTPWSRSSLMTLITGRYAHEHGITVDEKVEWSGAYMGKPSALTTINRQEPLPRLLSKAGYVSFQSGRWFEGNATSAGFTHGTVKKGDHSYDRPGIGEEAIKACTDFMDMAQKEGQPFLLWYAPALPAFNYNARADKFGGKLIPERLKGNQKFILSNGMDDNYLQFQDPGDRRDLMQYYSLVEWFDEHCGQLIEHLEKKGLRKNTLIIVQSANGWVSSRRRGAYAPRTKGSPYDGGVRSPVIYSWPGTIKPAVSDDLVSSIDVVPTILAATGATPPRKTLSGTNLLPVMEGKTNLDDRALFGESFDRNNGDSKNPEATLLTRWVIQKQYKLILTCDGKGSYAGGGKDLNGKDRLATEPVLFDLAKDPYEQTNLYGKLPKVAAALRTKLNGWYALKASKVIK
jgi:arylsulfatase A-like enzyme